MSDNMFGFSTGDLIDAIRYFSDKVAFEEENYYEACQIGIAERDCAKEREFDLMRIAVHCMKKELAFAKQEPLSPTNIRIMPHFKMGTCGVCGNDALNSVLKYCDQCGQKLDWEVDTDD